MKPNDELIGLGVLVFTVLLCAFITAITPYITRKSEAFGVSIPENKWEDHRLRAFRKAYLWGMLVAGVVGGAVVLLMYRFSGDMLATPLVAIFVVLGFSFVWYFRYHKQVKAIKAGEDWGSQTTSKVHVALGEEGNLPSAWWMLPAWLITAATIVFVLVSYPQLPQRIPMNYSFDGTVTRYAEKSLLTVMVLPFTQVFMTIIFSFSMYIIKRSRTVIDPENEQESLRQTLAFKRGWCWFTIAGGSLMVAMMGIIQLSMLGTIPLGGLVFATLVMPLALVAGAIWLSVRLGQGGSRWGTRPRSSSISIRDDDKYWKFGMFYYNPDDPALFVEKRFGVGWTSNFARPMTYVFLGILLVFIVGSIVMAGKAA